MRSSKRTGVTTKMLCSVRLHCRRSTRCGGNFVRRGPLLSALLLLGLSLFSAVPPAFADHSSPVLTYAPKEGPEGTVISFTIAGCKEAAEGPQGQPERDITISLFPSSFAGGDQQHFDIAADDEQVSGTFTVRTRAQYAASASGFDGRTIFLGVVCWEGGDTGFDAEFIITDTAQTTTTTTATTTTTSTTLPAATQPPAGSPDTQSEAQVSAATVAPGQQVSVTGGGFAPGRDLRADLFSDPVFLGSTRSDAAGRFATTVTIPVNASPGPHQIVVSGPGPQGGTHRSVATVTVVVTVARPLARTGGDSFGLVRLAIVSTLIGAVLLVSTERRLMALGLGWGIGYARPRHRIWRGGRPRRWPRF